MSVKHSAGTLYQKPKKLYILVMGLTGAGKSTFISIITGNKEILIGMPAEMDGVTQEVQDYVFIYKHEGKLYEIHLIDSPGFDDGAIIDAEVLARIADYVNTNYLLKRRLAGVLYLHDITKAKVGGVAQRNIRMLEQMIGRKKFNNCTLVTTKWGCTNNPQDEELRENTLRTQNKFFGNMLQNGQLNDNARIRRFDPKTKQTAIDIITPYLKREFTPHLAEQMVSPSGPKLALGETEAGKVVSDNLTKLAETKQELEKVNAAQALLAHKYDETLFEEYKNKSRRLRRQIRLQRSDR